MMYLSITGNKRNKILRYLKNNSTEYTIYVHKDYFLDTEIICKETYYNRTYYFGSKMRKDRALNIKQFSFEKLKKQMKYTGERIIEFNPSEEFIAFLHIKYGTPKELDSTLTLHLIKCFNKDNNTKIENRYRYESRFFNSKREDILNNYICVDSNSINIEDKYKEKF